MGESFAALQTWAEGWEPVFNIVGAVASAVIAAAAVWLSVREARSARLERTQAQAKLVLVRVISQVVSTTAPDGSSLHGQDYPIRYSVVLHNASSAPVTDVWLEIPGNLTFHAVGEFHTHPPGPMLAGDRWEFVTEQTTQRETGTEGPSVRFRDVNGRVWRRRGSGPPEAI